MRPAASVTLGAALGVAGCSAHVSVHVGSSDQPVKVTSTSISSTSTGSLPGSSVDGLPALEYPRVRDPNDPPSVTSRFTYFFSGHQEYRLLCVATPAHRAQVDAACDEALATITVPEPK